MIDHLSGLPGLSYTEFKAQLNSVYSPCCDDHAVLPNLAANDAIEDLLENMVRRVFRLKAMPPTIDASVTRYYADQLWNGIVEGYGADLPAVDFDTPDYTMLRNLQENVYQFSAAKNYQQLKSLTQALINDEGKLRTFREFKEAARVINNEHVNQWLRAEYDLAINSAQMASKWATIEENREVLPMLQFDAVLDDRTTATCRSLDGVTKPIDDTFWDLYYPPNHWGCRSSVRSLASGLPTPHEKIIYPDNIPDMFKTNMARNGVAFPKGHPYYTGLPEQVKEQADKLLHGR